MFFSSYSSLPQHLWRMSKKCTSRGNNCGSIQDGGNPKWLRFLFKDLSDSFEWGKDHVSVWDSSGHLGLFCPLPCISAAFVFRLNLYPWPGAAKLVLVWKPFRFLFSNPHLLPQGHCTVIYQEALYKNNMRSNAWPQCSMIFQLELFSGIFHLPVFVAYGQNGHLWPSGHQVISDRQVG